MEFIYKLLEWTPKVLPVLLKSAVVTLEVTIGSLIIALIILAMDQVFKNLMEFFYTSF